MRSELNCPGFEMAARGFEPCSFRLRVHLLKAVLLQCCRTAVLTIISSATEKTTFTTHKLYNGIYLEHDKYPEQGITLEHGIHSEHGIHPTLEMERKRGFFTSTVNKALKCSLVMW